MVVCVWILGWGCREHADLAFQTLTGPARPDKEGKLQKRVPLPGAKDYIQARLMYLKDEEK